ncbi:MAG: DUF6498-containing protein [bacterium]
MKLNYSAILRDPSFWTLLLANLFTIRLAVLENWSFSTVIWVYWYQSVIIGLFNFLRILTLKEFSTEGYTSNNKPMLPDQKTKLGTAFFFLIHYGIFHVVYASFLSQNTDLTLISAISAGALPIGIFFLNHLFSFFAHRPKPGERPRIGDMLVSPYWRIIPMHLSILFGVVLMGILPVFLGIKTLVDLAMHVSHWENTNPLTNREGTAQ